MSERLMWEKLSAGGFTIWRAKSQIADYQIVKTRPGFSAVVNIPSQGIVARWLAKNVRFPSAKAACQRHSETTR